MIRIKLMIPALLIMAFTAPCFSQISPDDLLSDINQLEELIRTKHVSPFWKVAQTEFEETLATAKATIQSKSNCDESCYVELLKIIASIKDGHSGISGGSRYELFGYLPLSLRWFDGELRVLKTSEQHQDILGFKVSKVNGMDIKQVLQRLRSVIPQANDSRFKKFVGRYLHLPGLLYGLGISDDPETVLFTFTNKNKVIEKKLTDMPPEIEDKTNFVSFALSKKKKALFQQKNDEYYWFDYNKKKNLFYLQYNRVGSMKTEGSTTFAKRMWAFVDSVEVDKFVLDLRYNGGGNFPFSLRFVQGILDRLDINDRGHLFIITGYDTFSAARQMLNQLEFKSEAIIIGEPPCDHPASPGDPKSYTLSNSQIKINLSSLYHASLFPHDKRNFTQLDETIITTWNDYSKGKDPNLKYVLKYKDDGKSPIEAKGFAKYLGRYEYSPTRHAQLKSFKNELWLEISHGLFTPLYRSLSQNYNTEIQGFSVNIQDDQLTLFFPDGTSRECKKLNEDLISPVEYFYTGKLKEAEKNYISAKSKDPDFIEFKDHKMSFLASIAYFDLVKYPDVKASEIAKSILQTGIQLNEGNSPFCKYSLRFY